MTCLNCNHSSGNHAVSWPYEQNEEGRCNYRTSDYEWCNCTHLKVNAN